jgi:hypothetical protein
MRAAGQLRKTGIEETGSCENPAIGRIIRL